MIEFQEALDIVMNSAFTMGTETVSFIDSSGRILAEDIKSDMDLPPFNKSTVDGFACRKTDLGGEMEIVETIPAGKYPKRPVFGNQCSRIMTGAAVPDGADMVFMVEDSDILPSGNVRCTAPFTKENISLMGEDIKNGAIVLRKGKIIQPQDIAVMAAVGCTSVVVSKMPEIAIISSGDELVEPFEKPDICQIRNINSYGLLAQVKRSGAIGKYYGIACDHEEDTFSLLDLAISASDIVLISGGVSMGDFDFIPAVMERAGVEILFPGVNVQPGKPTTFGTHKKALVFGLPGNPVSSFIQFELMVRPLIYKMMGYNWNPLTINLPVKETFTRRSSGRMALLPVKISEEGYVYPVEYHGSAHISALTVADGIISVPPGKKTIEKGEIVSVRQF